jgi:hypothetical protein
MKASSIVACLAVFATFCTCGTLQPPAPGHSAFTSPSATGTTVAPPPVSLIVIGEQFANLTDLDPIVTTLRQALAQLPHAASNGSSFVVEPILATAASGVTHSHTEPFFGATTTVLANVRKQKPANSLADRYLVVVNEKGQGEGATFGDVMFVTNEANIPTIVHEMGHGLAGLFDERGSNGGAPTNRKSRNCSSRPAYWLQDFPNADKNCDKYLSLLRPTDRCMMQSPSFSDFCKICLKHLKCALVDGQLGGCPETPPPTPLPFIVHGNDALSMEAIIDRNGEITLFPPTPMTVDAIRPQVITGDYFAVVRDDGRIVGIAPLAMVEGPADDAALFPLTARTYRRSDKSFDESTVPAEARLVRFIVTGVSLANMRTRDLTLELRRLTDAREKFFLDAATFTALTTRPDFVSPIYALQNAVNTLPP